MSPPPTFIARSLMPIMTICFCFQLMDKLALSYTSILGIREDLHLSDSDYSWANSIYYFGYLAASYPSAVLMVRLPVAKLIAGSLFSWGAIAMLTATCRDATGLLINRFFLGVAEAPLTSGLTIIVAMWYTRDEQPFRQSIWYLGGSIGTLIGSFVGLGVHNIQVIAAWKALYLILGSATVVGSIVVLFLLPDVPSAAWFLTKEERVLVIARVSDNLTGIKATNFSWSQFREAICDVNTWLLVLNQLALNIPNGGLHPFLNIFLRGTGFSEREVFLLNACQFPILFFMKLYVGWASTRYKNTRIFWMIVCLCISALGILLMRQLPPHLKWGRWAGAVLTDMYTANYGLLAALTSGNFAGFTKKSVAATLIFAAGCAGSIIGPQLFSGSEAPAYPTGYLAMLICVLATIVLSFIMLIYTIWENRRRDRTTCTTDEVASDSADMMDGIVANLSDKTDRELNNCFATCVAEPGELAADRQSHHTVTIANAAWFHQLQDNCQPVEGQPAPARPSSTSPSTTHRHQDYELRLPKATAPARFVRRIAKPLHAIAKPSLTYGALNDFRTSVTKMEFATGEPINSKQPKLLKLLSVDHVRDFVCRGKPWVMFTGEIRFHNFLPDPPKARHTAARTHHRAAELFATTLEVWAVNCESQRAADPLLFTSSWSLHSDRAAARWLGMRNGDEYIWEYGTAFHNLQPIIPGQGVPPCEPSLPHAICYAVDSAPFEDDAIRSSELKSIVFLAVVNNMKAEYNHLSSFGVTVISFWNCIVRIVQGLVNLRTLDIDLRVSPPQHFPNGFRLPDGSIDERFLTLLAYNCSQVLPLPNAANITSSVIVKRVCCLMDVRLLALALWLSAHLPAAYTLLRVAPGPILQIPVIRPLFYPADTCAVSISAMYSVPTKAAERKDSQCDECAHDDRTNHARHGR
ncbi:hypothetical protein LLEC1_06984, partial [Akanthomyces lecanii]